MYICMLCACACVCVRVCVCVCLFVIIIIIIRSTCLIEAGVMIFHWPFQFGLYFSPLHISGFFMWYLTRCAIPHKTLELQLTLTVKLSFCVWVIFIFSTGRLRLSQLAVDGGGNLRAPGLAVRRERHGCVRWSASTAWNWRTTRWTTRDTWVIPLGGKLLSEHEGLLSNL